jgi:tetratricopeptide (TPR) repeat protein
MTLPILKARFLGLLFLVTLVVSSSSCGLLGIPANVLGTIEYNRGNTRKAVGHFDSAIYWHPEYRFARNNRGVANHADSNFSDSLIDFEVATQRWFFTYANAYKNRSVLMLERWEDERSLLDIDTSLTMRERYKRAHFNRARHFLATEELDRALESINLAIEIHENDLFPLKEFWAPFYYFRAMVKWHLGDMEGAQEDVDIALKANENLLGTALDPYPSDILVPGVLGM